LGEGTTVGTEVIVGVRITVEDPVGRRKLQWIEWSSRYGGIRYLKMS